MVGAMIRLCLLAGLTLVLASCALDPDRLSRRGVEPDVESRPTNQLAAQTLPAGACASFFWSRDGQDRLLVFDNETAGFARVYLDGETREFTTPRSRGNPVMGDPYRRDWIDPALGLELHLTAVIGERAPTGTRIERAILRRVSADGTEQVIPLQGQYVCRTV
tara:strand:+ start:11046 stop:11534 length:489 start_codon:yes stop_codon:yes gene_type:complete